MYTTGVLILTPLKVWDFQFLEKKYYYLQKIWDFEKVSTIIYKKSSSEKPPKYHFFDHFPSEIALKSWFFRLRRFSALYTP